MPIISFIVSVQMENEDLLNKYAEKLIRVGAKETKKYLKRIDPKVRVEVDRKKR